ARGAAAGDAPEHRARTPQLDLGETDVVACRGRNLDAVAGPHAARGRGERDGGRRRVAGAAAPGGVRGHDGAGGRLTGAGGVGGGRAQGGGGEAVVAAGVVDEADRARGGREVVVGGIARARGADEGVAIEDEAGEDVGEGGEALAGAVGLHAVGAAGGEVVGEDEVGEGA